jgi:hypothetical protein
MPPQGGAIFLGLTSRLWVKAETLETGRRIGSLYKSNSLQLMKNWHCGLEQTKRHF